MRHLLTTGIILKRTDYGEADRIITVLTPDQGKLRLMARGVRKVKSKLAGGIELFSTSHLTYVPGKGEIGTLISSRLISHYGGIVKDIGRVQLGYELIKQLDRATEDNPEPAYYYLLEQAFSGLNEPAVGLELLQAWFGAQLLKLAGHTPNLSTDAGGRQLVAGGTYSFDFDVMAFRPQAKGVFRARQITALRLLFGPHGPQELQKVGQLESAVEALAPLLRRLSSQLGGRVLH